MNEAGDICSQAWPGPLVYRIRDYTDDGTEVGDTSWHHDGCTNGVDYMGKAEDNTAFCVGLRFHLADVNQGDSVVFARLRFASQGGLVTTGANLRIRGEDVDGSPPLSHTRRPSVLPKTDAAVDWEITETWRSPVAFRRTPLRYSGPDVSPIINEVIGRSAWGTGLHGKHIVLIVEDDSSAAHLSNHLKFEDMTSCSTGYEDPAILEIYCTLADAFIGKELLGRPTSRSVTVNLIHLLAKVLEPGR